MKAEKVTLLFIQKQLFHISRWSVEHNEDTKKLKSFLSSQWFKLFENKLFQDVIKKHNFSTWFSLCTRSASSLPPELWGYTMNGGVNSALNSIVRWVTIPLLFITPIMSPSQFLSLTKYRETYLETFLHTNYCNVQRDHVGKNRRQA